MTNREKKEYDFCDHSWQKFELYTNLFLVSKAVYDKPHTSSPHIHDYAQLLYCAKKSFKHTVAGKEFECKKGSLSVVPPGTLHSFNVDAGAEIVYINISYNAFNNRSVRDFPTTMALAFLYEVNDKAKLPLSLCYSSSESPEKAEALISSLVTETYMPKAEGDPLAELERFLSFFLSLTKEEEERAELTYNSRVKPIVAALDWLNTHYMQKINCSELLRVTALCKTDFYEYFHCFVGITYSLYLQSVRVSRAYRAIAFTPYSLSYIANMCGFGDNAYMTKCYKKHKGVTPSQTRERNDLCKPEYSYLRVYHNFFDTEEK